MARREVPLPSPRVVLDRDFERRLGAFARRLAGGRERREGAGRSQLFGVGTEFVGYRPYRPGEDLRQLDWNLYARLGKPFVRVARREASEHWAVLLDTSASMGVGVPGKLQSAAEVATAIAAVALASGASVTLWTSGAERAFRLRRRSDLAGWRRFLEEEVAAGERGLGALAREPARAQGAGRVFLLGDLFDLEPAEVLGLVRRARELFLGQVLAPEELAPVDQGAVEWVDPESGEALLAGADPGSRAAYEAALAGALEAWRAFATRHRARHHAWSSARPFEQAASGLCGL